MAEITRPIDFPQLVELAATFCGPAKLDGVDFGGGCFCGDAGAFIIKTNGINPNLAHTEWFCSSIANCVGVPQVPFSVIRHTDDSQCFGSHWQQGKVNDWWNLAKSGQLDFGEISTDISKIYALDLFLHNPDRHIKNYMVVRDGAAHKVLAFDYSRAWLHNGTPPLPPILNNGGDNTIQVKNWMKIQLGYTVNMDSFNEVLGRIEATPLSTIQSIINQHPKNWLTQDVENAILNWWSDGGVATRIASIRV